MIMRILWLACYNPEINWKIEEDVIKSMEDSGD